MRRAPKNVGIPSQNASWVAFCSYTKLFECCNCEVFSRGTEGTFACIPARWTEQILHLGHRLKPTDDWVAVL
jgi:hypothetical protein